MRIDSHQHFWRFDPVRDSWITDEMGIIRRDFLPGDLLPVLTQNNFSGCITVQSSQSDEENIFQLNNAGQHDFIKGIVGWVDLQARDIHEKLAELRPFKKLKGFRHVLQSEADRSLMLKPAFKNGIKALCEFGYTYDLLILPDQLKYAAELVAEFPYQQFIIDHIAKPMIKAKQPGDWENDIRTVASFPNVCCKVSGMVTEADWRNWQQQDFDIFLDTVTEAFGTGRLLFGSDWPVCLVAASYEQVHEIAARYFAKFSTSEQAAVFGGNATAIYKLN